MNYVLITPARNEEAFIERTIQSVVRQTLHPLRWVIVSDGSTDGTDEIVSRYAARHNWIELLRMPKRDSRDFSGKAGCFNAGYAHVAGSTGVSPVPAGVPPGELETRNSKLETPPQPSSLNPALGTTGASPVSAGVPPGELETRNSKLETPPHSDLRPPHSTFEVIVSLDADLSFDENYFSFLLQKLAEDPKLGIVGTPFSENGETYDYRFSSTEYVSGACQLFRRECFEAIGGYVPMKGGGIDVVAVQTARLKGWRTRTFPEKVCIHHRPMGSANHKDRLVATFKLGRRAYTLGWHPVWQIFRSVYQMTKRPYVTGGCALFCGYFWSMLCRIERPVSAELIDFQRRDQMKRLRSFFLSCLGGKKEGVSSSASIASRSVHPAK